MGGTKATGGCRISSGRWMRSSSLISTPANDLLFTRRVSSSRFFSHRWKSLMQSLAYNAQSVTRIHFLRTQMGVTYHHKYAETDGISPPSNQIVRTLTTKKAQNAYHTGSLSAQTLDPPQTRFSATLAAIPNCFKGPTGPLPPA